MSNNKNDSKRKPEYGDKTYKGKGGSKRPNKYEKSSSPKNCTAGNRFSPYNDGAWYSANPALLAAAARIPFPFRPGMRVPVDVHRRASSSTTCDVRIPGVMSIGYAPTIGISRDVTSAASIAARELYGQIRKNYSSSLDADGPDLIMYLFALDQLHAYLEHCKRVYGVVMKYTGNNHEFPDQILNAMGFQARGRQDLRTRHTEMWGRINNLVYNANKFALPADFHLFQRHMWMNHTLYMDIDSEMGQVYLFVPTHYYVVNEVLESGTSLTAKSIELLDMDLDSLLAPAEEMVKALSEWGDAYTIDGYIRRSFADQKWLASDLLDQNYVVQPTYSEEVLQQIENLTVINNLSGLDITQDPSTNAVLCTPRGDMLVDSDFVNWNTEPILNMHKDIPAELDVTTASRLTSYFSGYAAGSSNAKYDTCGTEIVNFVRIYHEGRDCVFNLIHSTALLHDDMNAGQAIVLISELAQRSWWTRCPMLTLIEVPAEATSGTVPTNVIQYGDLDNLNTVDRDALARLNHVCTLSEFNCYHLSK